MKPNRRVFVLGGAHTPFIGKMHPDFIWKRHPDFGVRENPTLETLMHKAVADALEQTGLTARSVQKGFVGNFAGELFSSQGHLGAMVARGDAGFEGTPMTRVEAACASGGLAVVGCIESIQAGHDVTLALGAEVQTTVSARDGAGFLARASHWESERDIDEFTFPAMFGRRNKLYKEATGATDADIGHVTAKAYDNANNNPNAHMRAVKMDLDRASHASDKNPFFLKNLDYREHLKISDCSQVSDGASAMILVSEAGARRLGVNPDDLVELISYSQTVSALGKVKDYTRLSNTQRAAEEAYRDAGLGPKDMGIAEVHDCFAVTEVMMTEALGFADFGLGGKIAREGLTRRDGSIPVNTGGGLLAFGHPVGATGVKQVLEIARQMHGQCGDYQVPGIPKYGITANMGGDDRTTVCTILRNNPAHGA